MSAANCSNRPHQHSHAGELIFLTSEACLIAVINAAFLAALFRRRKFVNWKSTVFVANVAVSDLLCSFSLIATAGSLLNVTITGPNEQTFEYVIQLVTTFSTGITVLNYNALFLVQYFSIQRPLIYRTRCTWSAFVYMLIGQWAALTAYVALKAVMIKKDSSQLKFSTGELSLMAFVMVFNTVTYGYVLYVSAARTMRQLERRREKGGDESAKEKSCATRIAFCGTLLTDYRNTITAGLHLLVYISTFAPMLVVRVDVAVNGCPDHIHCGDRGNIYACACVACRVTLYVWYLGAIIDPLLQTAREPQLWREWLRWARCLRPRLGSRKKESLELTAVPGHTRGPDQTSAP